MKRMVVPQDRLNIGVAGRFPARRARPDAKPRGRRPWSPQSCHKKRGQLPPTFPRLPPGDTGRTAMGVPMTLWRNPRSDPPHLNASGSGIVWVQPSKGARIETELSVRKATTRDGKEKKEGRKRTKKGGVCRDVPGGDAPGCGNVRSAGRPVNRERRRACCHGGPLEKNRRPARFRQRMNSLRRLAIEPDGECSQACADRGATRPRRRRCQTEAARRRRQGRPRRANAVSVTRQKMAFFYNKLLVKPDFLSPVGDETKAAHSPTWLQSIEKQGY